MYSHLVYAIQIWGSEFDTNIKKMPGPLSASVPIFSKLEILKLNIFIFQISRFIHNCLNSNIIFKTCSNLMRFTTSTKDQIAHNMNVTI